MKFNEFVEKVRVAANKHAYWGLFRQGSPKLDDLVSFIKDNFTVTLPIGEVIAKQMCDDIFGKKKWFSIDNTFQEIKSLNSLLDDDTSSKPLETLTIDTEDEFEEWLCDF